MKIVNKTAILGEDAAVSFLKRLNYRIVERNFRKGYGEIDIITIDSSEKPPVLVFVEVKTRTSNLYGTPLESITPWKLRSVIKTAEFYKMLHPKLPDSLRIDAIAVIVNGDEVVDIEHHKNIGY